MGQPPLLGLETSLLPFMGQASQTFWDTALLSRRSHLDKGAAVHLTLLTPGGRERTDCPRTVSGDLLQTSIFKITRHRHARRRGARYCSGRGLSVGGGTGWWLEQGRVYDLGQASLASLSSFWVLKAGLTSPSCPRCPPLQ